MKKVTIIMKPYSFLYNNSEYDFYGLNEAVNLINKHIKIVILEEQLFIKIFEIKKDIKKMSAFIQDKINNIFPQNGEILYDYEKNNSDNLLAIYSVKGKKKIEKLSMNAKELEVVPIQFVIKDEFLKIFKNKKLTCSVIFRVEDSFYYIYIKNGLLYENYICGDLNGILQRVPEEGGYDVYIDSNIAYENTHKDKIKFIEINMEGLIYEKLFEK
ncbi:MAG: hypothetical protein Q4F66_05040 [Clostridium sp.]|nr:hypothetical protein [Clostridium sp.]